MSVPLKYVGASKRYFDTVNGSREQWTPGRVSDVADAAAVALIQSGKFAAVAGAEARYTAAQLTTLAAAGGLTPNASYVASDSLRRGTARSASVLSWDDAENVIVVPPATGVVATDVANINAALAAATNNSTVRFSAGGVYAYGYKAGTISTGSRPENLPAMIDMNGATLLHCGLVATAVTTASYTAGTNQTIQLGAGQAAQFAVGDRVSIYGATYAANVYADGGTVTAVNTALDQITLSSIVFTVGAATGIGAFVQHNDAILLQNNAVPVRTSAASTILCNGRIDGASTARYAAGVRQYYVGNIGVDFVGAMATVRNCVFVNHVSDALGGASVPYFKVTECHFENVFGSGVHPGGSTTVTVEAIFMGNSFYNVTQATNATTPTIDQFGHARNSGAMVNSFGPVKAIIANNVVDGATRYGFSGITTTGTDYAISGNQFSNCGAGAFVVSGGNNVAISGNHILNCGRDTNHTSAGVWDQTNISGNAGESKNVTISGNTFIDSVLNLVSDAYGVTISGNLFNTSGLTNVDGNTNANITAAISMRFSSAASGCNRITISGNTIINAINTAGALNGIYMNRGQDINVVGNTIVGGRHGFYAQAGSSNPLINVRVSDNIFTDQGMTSGGASPTAIAWLVGACTNCAIENNTISTNNSSTMTPVAIDCFTPSISASSLTVRNNRIRTVTSRLQGIRFDTGATYTGSNITVVGNEIDQINAGDVSIRVPTTGTLTGCFFLMNRMRGGSGLPTWGTCVSTIGGGTDSNWAS